MLVGKLLITLVLLAYNIVISDGSLLIVGFTLVPPENSTSAVEAFLLLMLTMTPSHLLLLVIQHSCSIQFRTPGRFLQRTIDLSDKQYY